MPLFFTKEKVPGVSTKRSFVTQSQASGLVLMAPKEMKTISYFSF